MQAESCNDIALKAKKIGLNIWTYTGYTFEEILSSGNEDFIKFLKNTDVLVDGKFVLKERSLELNFRGSKNQRIIDVKKTLSSGNIVLHLT